MAPPASAPSGDDEPLISMRNAVTGSEVEIPTSSLQKPRELRRRLRMSDPQSSLVVSDADINVDTQTKRYWFSRNPSVGAVLAEQTGVKLPAQLGFLGSLPFVVFGALLIAAAAQITFLFPCIIGYTGVFWQNGNYCVDTNRLSEVTPTNCPVDLCGSKRIPVTMQTYAVLLNGAVGGTSGTLATIFYVFLVCVGAPFGAGGHIDYVWNPGSLVGPSGGYFWGFIAATAIMARCAAQGHDRPRSAYWMILWMAAAEVAMYACAIFWLPFGVAIVTKTSPSAYCAAGATACLNKLFTSAFVPFVAGDLFKMLLVLVTVPLLWQATLMWFQYRNKTQLARARSSAPLPGLEEDDHDASTTTAVAVRGGDNDASTELAKTYPTSTSTDNPAATVTRPASAADVTEWSHLKR